MCMLFIVIFMSHFTYSWYVLMGENCFGESAIFKSSRVFAMYIHVFCTLSHDTVFVMGRSAQGYHTHGVLRHTERILLNIFATKAI